MQKFSARAKTLVVATLALAAATPLAAMPRDRGDCTDSGSTHEIVRCATRELAAADQRLNRAYQDALTEIARARHLDGTQRQAWAQSLRDAQRQWVQFREADCGAPIGWEWYQGTGMGAASLGCMIRKTDVRADELRDRYGAR